MTDEKLIESEAEALDFWGKRFTDTKNVGWGSVPQYEWYHKKRNALESVLENDMSVLDVGCGDFSIIEEIITKHNCDYRGIDGTPEIVEHNLKEFPDKTFELKTFSEISSEKVSTDVIIAYDILFHIPEDKTYTKFVKWLFSQDAQYILVTYHKASKKVQEFQNGHFIPRPFKVKQKGYDITFETEFADRNDLKLIVYKKS